METPPPEKPGGLSHKKDGGARHTKAVLLSIRVLSLKRSTAAALAVPSRVLTGYSVLF